MFDVLAFVEAQPLSYLDELEPLKIDDEIDGLGECMEEIEEINKKRRKMTDPLQFLPEDRKRTKEAMSKISQIEQRISNLEEKVNAFLADVREALHA